MWFQEVSESVVKLDVENFVPRTRVVRGMFLGVCVAFGLALAYVYGGGMELLGNSQFETVDGYAFTIALLVGSLVPLSYWLFFRDVSEAVAIHLTLVWSLFFGLEDVFVYAVSPKYSIPEVLPWLNDSLVGLVAGFLGFSQVTRTALFAVILVTGLLLVFLVKTLDSFEENYLGLKI